ncbi:hypothetical protein Tco_0309880 [Tanacetum coccineum]
MSIRELQEQVDALAQAVKQYCSNRSCSCCQGSSNGENCPNFFNQPPQHRMETYSCEYCGGILHPGFDFQTCHNSSTVVSFVEVYIIVMIAKQGTCPSMITVLVTIKTLVITNLHFILNINNSSSTVVRENNNILEEMLRTQMPNSPVVLKEYEGILSDEIYKATMEPTNTLLMGDEVISTIPIKEINEFIKSSVDDLVPIPRESEVTYDSNLECDMPATAPLPPLMLGKKILISIRL